MSYYRASTVGRYGKVLSQPSATSYTFPASVGGVNAIDALISMPQQDSIYSYNLMPTEYGQTLRKGFKEYAKYCYKNVEFENPAADVKTLIPYQSNKDNKDGSALFSVTSEGIWDLEPRTLPTLNVAFDNNSNAAGYGVSCEFTNDAEKHYAFYADSVNGLFQYDDDNKTWSAPDQQSWYIGEPNEKEYFPVDEIAFIMVFKQRIWVILRDSSDAWYLPVASIQGQLKKFTFGSKMPHGGNLQGLYNWTVDGGLGVEDMLVAISRGGDAIVYQGEDPEVIDLGVNTFTVRGAWYIGEVPDSRRIAIGYGPDLYVLSSYGLVSINSLVQGGSIEQNSPSRKVSKLLRTDIKTGFDSSGWQIVINPSDGFLQIITPKSSSGKYLQYNLNTLTGAWGFWQGVPALCGANFEGEYYFGSPGGDVNIYDGLLDGVEITDRYAFKNDGPTGIGPEWSVNDNEYTCDGSQSEITAYTCNKALIVPASRQDSQYTITYSIKEAESFNLNNNIWAGDIPIIDTRWEYKSSISVSGTVYSDIWSKSPAEQGSDPLLIKTTNVLKAGKIYSFSFKFKANSARPGGFTFGLLPSEITPGIGTKIYTSELTPNSFTDVSFEFTPPEECEYLALYANPEMEGDWCEITITSKESVGTHQVGAPATDNFPDGRYTESASGAGTFSSGPFDRDVTNTALSLRGGPNFVGTFYNIYVEEVYSRGTPINFRSLTSFQAPAGHSNYIRVGLIRSVGLANVGTDIEVKAVYDYNISDIAFSGKPTDVNNTGAIWNVDFWDSCFWDYNLTGGNSISGAAGIGRTFAVAVAGSARQRITIIGYDCLLTTGGFL